MEAMNDCRPMTSTGDRWAAVDSYLVCVSECSLDDGACVTRCMEVHLKPEESEEQDRPAI